MLDTDVLVLKPFGFVLRLDQQFVQPLRDLETGGRRRVTAHTRDAGQFLSQFCFEQVGRHLGFLEPPGHQAPLLLEQGQPNMLDIDCLMRVSRGEGLRLNERLLGLVGESVQVHNYLLVVGSRRIVQILTQDRLPACTCFSVSRVLCSPLSETLSSWHALRQSFRQGFRQRRTQVQPGRVSADSGQAGSPSYRAWKDYSAEGSFFRVKFAFGRGRTDLRFAILRVSSGAKRRGREGAITPARPRQSKIKIVKSLRAP